jgi:hypothetical protein
MINVFSYWNFEYAKIKKIYELVESYKIKKKLLKNYLNCIYFI